MKGILKISEQGGWKVSWYEEGENSDFIQKELPLCKEDNDTNIFNGDSLSYWEGREVEFNIQLTCDKSVCLCKEDDGFKNCRCNIEVAKLTRRVSQYCKGEKCHCGKDAVQKIQQVIFDDMPVISHPLVQYVCQECFDKALRPYKSKKTYINNNVKEFRYEDSKESVTNFEGPTVFLAGPTVRGHQQHLTSWRFAAIEEFRKQGFQGALIIPEFTSKAESDKGKKWIPLWEMNGLKKADCILFWIPRTKELIGLTTNWELGFWMGHNINKLVYGRPDDAYRIDYLDTMWETEYCGLGSDKEIYHTLEDTVREAIKKANTLYSANINNNFKI